MPPSEPTRIVIRDAQGNIRAMAECTADPAVTLSAYDAQGGQVAYAQVGGDGSVTLSANGAVIGIDASGRIVLAPMNGLVLQVPDADPHDAGVAYTDNGILKVSAG